MRAGIITDKNMKNSFPRTLFSFAIPLIFLTASCQASKPEPRQELVFNNIPCAVNNYKIEDSDVFKYFGTFINEKRTILFKEKTKQEGIDWTTLLPPDMGTYDNPVTKAVVDNLALEQVKGTSLDMDGQTVEISCYRRRGGYRFRLSPLFDWRNKRNWILYERRKFIGQVCL